MKNKIKTSNALKRVWKWKAEIYKEVKDFEINEQLKRIHKMAEEIETQNENTITS